VARNVSRHPTELELDVLQVLWEAGPLTGGQIRDTLASRRELTYQSVMTILGIMENKSYVRRKKNAGRFEYRARVTQQATSRRMLRDLVDRLFGGSTTAAMINLLESSDLSEDELNQLRNEVERNRREN